MECRDRAASVSRDEMLRAITWSNSPQGCEVILAGKIKSLAIWRLGACAVKNFGKPALFPALPSDYMRKTSLFHPFEQGQPCYAEVGSQLPGLAHLTYVLDLLHISPIDRGISPKIAQLG